jgi:hypothetical protein
LIDDDSVFELGAPEGRALFAEEEGEAGTELLFVEDSAAKEPGDDGNDDGGLDKENGALLKSNVDVQSQSEVVTATVVGLISKYTAWAATSRTPVAAVIVIVAWQTACRLSYSPAGEA